jgi:hypothetical protein
MVVVLSLDLRLSGTKLAKDDGFLRTIEIRTTTSFGGEVKPSAPCRKILRYAKDTCGA